MGQMGSQCRKLLCMRLFCDHKSDLLPAVILLSLCMYK